MSAASNAPGGTASLVNWRPAGYADPAPWPKPETHSAPAPPAGMARIAGLVEARRAHFAHRLAQTEGVLKAAVDALDSARALRTEYDTRETRAGIVEAKTLLDFAKSDFDVATAALATFEATISSNRKKLDRLAQLDADQCESCALAAHAAIAATAKKAGQLLADCLSQTRALAQKIDVARTEASDLAKGLGGLAWTPGRVDHSTMRGTIRTALREGFRVCGLFESSELERLVR